jgi:hypothetical protein
VASIKELSSLDLLTSIDNLEDEDCAVYMPKNGVWTLNTTFTVICDDDDDDYENDDDEPQYAKQNNLKYVLNTQTFCDIIYNARLQKNQVSLEDLFRAFNFYYENDAFIDFEIESP